MPLILSNKTKSTTQRCAFNFKGPTADHSCIELEKICENPAHFECWNKEKRSNTITAGHCWVRTAVFKWWDVCGDKPWITLLSVQTRAVVVVVMKAEIKVEHKQIIFPQWPWGSNTSWWPHVPPLLTATPATDPRRGHSFLQTRSASSLTLNSSNSTSHFKMPLISFNHQSSMNPSSTYLEYNTVHLIYSYLTSYVIINDIF